jgi:phosphatidylglycerol:prolipoprotein diacylglycerol transferase
VLNDIFGGGRSFIDTPGRLFRITEGGLHIYGAILFGGLVAYIYARKKKIDLWMLLDAVGPALLIGQALARPANYINQELYGPPTDLAWGIPIDEVNRIPLYQNLEVYPVETTRFHPTFAYEIIWNFLAAGVLLWVTRRFKARVKPGAAFAAWLLLAGIGRVVIESFRPDQPRIPGTEFSYSRLVAALMAIAGLVWLLIRYEVIKIPFLSPGPENYQVVRDRKWKKKREA